MIDQASNLFALFTPGMKIASAWGFGVWFFCEASLFAFRFLIHQTYAAARSPQEDDEPLP